MTTSLVTPPVQDDLVGASLKPQIDGIIEELIASLPDPDKLTAGERRGIIARYTAVLEGNFIYWMTATYLSVKSEEARPILLDNLREEIRDCHPAMLRNFTIAAHAFPTDSDALEVHQDLTNVRLFLGRLSGVRIFSPWHSLRDSYSNSWPTWRTSPERRAQWNAYTQTCMGYATWRTHKNFFAQSLRSWRLTRLTRQPTCLKVWICFAR